MEITRNEMFSIVKDYALGKRTLADTCLLLETVADQTVIHIRGGLHQSASYAGVGATPGTPDWRLADLLWKLTGPSECLSQHFLPTYAYLQEFLANKIREEFNHFTDSDIQLLRGKCPWLAPLIDESIAKRVTEKLSHLKTQGAEPMKDVAEVKRRVTEYAFNPELNELLDKVDEELMDPGDQFDQAAALKHLRTFYEKLHEHVGQELQRRKPDTVNKTNLGSCGQALDFLRDKTLLKEKMHALGKALYGVLSNEGVHAIKSTREYVRLCRNMVAEYAIVLFFELERRIA